MRSRTQAMTSEAWDQLVTQIESDHGIEANALLNAVAAQLVRLEPPATPSAKPGLVTTRDLATGLLAAFWEAAPDDARFEHLFEPRSVALSEAVTDTLPPPETLFAHWLSYYGPVRPAWVQKTLGIGADRLEAWVAELKREDLLIQGPLMAEDDDQRICDAENIEILLRMRRARSRSGIQALPLEDLPLLMAQHQELAAATPDTALNAADRSSLKGRVDRRSGPDAVFAHLVRLSGWPAKAAQWEAELLPVRLPAYQTAWLDAVLQEGELLWQGCGSERLTFCYPDELDLLAPDNGGAGIAALESGDPKTEPDVTDDAHSTVTETEGSISVDFGGEGVGETARYPFASLAANQPMERIYADLWQGVWAGRWVNDGFQAVRQAIANRFKWPTGGAMPPRTGRQRRRTGRGRRPRQLKVPGNWYRPAAPPPPEDELAALEIDKERVRLLLERYGILFRPLLAHELAPMRWGRLFRALRLMELSGEVVGGHFIEGVPGPHFVSPRMQRTLRKGLQREAIFFLNAVDPASVCGLGLEWPNNALPARRPSTHLVYHGNRLVLVSRRRGRRLRIHVAPDDAYLEEYLDVIRHILMNKVNASSGVVIERINAEPAPASPYLDALRTHFEVNVDPGSVTVYQPWTSSA